MDTTSLKEVTLSDSSVERKPDQATNENVLPDWSVINNVMDVRYASMVNTLSEEKEATVKMPAGGLLTYTLPDRSKVWLNAVSTIKFPYVFNGPIRNVKITGEAYFEVQPDGFRPFQVVANGVRLEVYSGRFNISDYAEDGKTIVTALEGHIHIVTGPIDTILDTGQSAVIDSERKLTLIQTVVDRITDWKMDLFLFNDDDLEFVAHEVARWYGLTVEFNTKSKTRISWAGSRQDKIADVIKGIMSQNNVRINLQGSRLIIN
jgi:transmembrane sensor